MKIFFFCGARSLAPQRSMRATLRAHPHCRFEYRVAARGGARRNLLMSNCELNSKRDAQRDVFFGTEVEDPYRWLEDPDGDDSRAWIGQQQRLFDSYCEGTPSRELIKRKLTEKYNYVKTGSFFKQGHGAHESYYFYKNDGLQNQYVLYKQKTLSSEPSVFFDPNKLSSDGTQSLGALSWSEDGDLWAYGVSQSGSDWQTLHVLNVATGAHLDDVIKWVKFSGISWLHDGSGFFYSRYPEPAAADAASAGTETGSNTNAALYFHAIGTPQSADVLVFNRPDFPKWMFSITISDDGQDAVLSTSDGCAPVNHLYMFSVAEFKRLLDTRADIRAQLTIKRIVENFDAGYTYITNDGPMFKFITNHGAARYKVVSLDVSSDPPVFSDFIPESASNVLDDATAIGNILVCTYLIDAHDEIHLFDLASGSFIRTVDLPDIGSVSCSGRREDPEFFYSFSGFVYPGTRFRFDIRDMSSQVVSEDVVMNHDPANFQTLQVFYHSKDGTRVPMYIISRRSKVPSPDTCALLYGYGGFSINMKPSFSAFRTVLMHNMDAIVCIANIRGGAEYGEDWHKAGATAPALCRSAFCGVCRALQRASQASPPACW
jgi:prolyl oligopeptidase